MVQSEANSLLAQWVQVYNLSSHFFESAIMIKGEKRNSYARSNLGYIIEDSEYISIVPSIDENNTLLYSVASKVDCGWLSLEKGQAISVARVSFGLTNYGYLRCVSWMRTEKSLVCATLSPAWDAEAGCFVADNVDISKKKAYLASITSDELENYPNIDRFFEVAGQSAVK